MNRNSTGKLQVTLLSPYISRKKLCLHTFKDGRSNHDAFWETKGKIHEGGCMKEFFSKTWDWHLAISLQINFFTDNFQGF